MRWSTFIASLAAPLILVAAPPRSDASSMLSGYTVSDLGSTYHWDYLGPGYIVSADGQTGYSYTKGQTLIPWQQRETLRWPVGPTLGWQNPPGDSVMDSSVVNPNGTLVGRELSGLQGGAGAQVATIFTAQLQPDGTFGPPKILWSSPFSGHFSWTPGSSSTGPVPEVLGLTPQGELFGTMVVPGTGTTGGRSEDILYDLKTGTYSVLPDRFGPWTLDHANNIDGSDRIDDQGRLVVWADRGDGTGDHALLLTPDAIYTGPVSTPEPSTLAILGVGAVGAWWHRRHRARWAA